MDLIKKTFEIFRGKIKKIHFFCFFLLFITSALLEIFSIGLLYPISLAVIDPKKLEAISFLNQLINYFNLNYDLNQVDLIKYFILSFFSLLILKNFFLIFINYQLNKFIENAKATLREKITNYFSFLGAKKFIDVDQNEILNFYLEQSQRICAGVLRPLANIFKEGFFLILILISILIVDIRLIFLFLFLGFACFLLYKLIFNISYKLGKDYLGLNTDYIRLTKEIISSHSLKDIYNFFDLFKEKQFKIIRKISKNFTIRNLISESIRPALEIVALFFFGGLFFFFFKAENFSILISIFVTSAFGLLRILPTLSNLNISLNQIYTNIFVIEKINNFFKYSYEEKNLKLKKIINLKNKISLKNIKFTYRNRLVFKNKSFNLRKGDIIAITGDNGSGKSTLLKIITNIYEPDKGQIYIDNNVINKKSDTSKIFSYVDQNNLIFDQNVFYNITLIKNNNFNFQKKYFQNSNYYQLIKDIFDKKKLTRLGENGKKLSGGQCQRIAIARAFEKNTQIICYDEPSSKLDFNSKNKIYEQIKNFKKIKTQIIITHDPKFISLADKVIKL